MTVCQKAKRKGMLKIPKEFLTSPVTVVLTAFSHRFAAKSTEISIK